MKRISLALIAAGFIGLHPEEGRAIVTADYAVATNAPTGSWNVDWTNVYNY